MSLKSIKSKFDLDYIDNNPVTYAEEESIKTLVSFIKHANHYYYNTAKSLVSDYAYDEIKDILARRDPDNPILLEVGAPETAKKKVTLPYWMGSMSKVKPGDKKLARWKKNYTGDYIVSDKLDGNSGLIIFNYNNKPVQVFSRGDGKVGGDWNHLIPYLDLPKITTKLAVRGEFVVKKSVFAHLKQDKKIHYNNPRSFVSGVFNHKTINPELVSLIDFVAYEMIFPWTKIESQLIHLQKYGFNLVWSETYKTVTEAQLKTLYLNRLETTPYDIDGLIVSNVGLHTRNTSGNPEYSRAFKLDLQKFATKVTDMIWTPSKDGFIKPVAVYESVMIDGNKHNKATCSNARFVVDNKIGKGAMIEIIRTNDVLPKVVGIIKPATQMIYPEDDYDWNKSHVEFVLVDRENNKTVKIKRLVRFFTTLKIENLSEGLLTLFYNKGYDTIDKILRITIHNLEDLPKFGRKMATKIYHNIHKVIDRPIPLELLMTASNAFQHGFAAKKFKSVLLAYPGILIKPPTIDEIVLLNGWDYTTAKPFLDRLPYFVDFLDLHPYLRFSLPKKETITKGHVLAQHKIVFTGFRDKEMETKIVEMGGTIQANVSGTTTMLVTKDLSAMSSKIAKAQDKKIPILTPEQFRSQYL